LREQRDRRYTHFSPACGLRDFPDLRSSPLKQIDHGPLRLPLPGVVLPADAAIPDFTAQAPAPLSSALEDSSEWLISILAKPRFLTDEWRFAGIAYRQHVSTLTIVPLWIAIVPSVLAGLWRVVVNLRERRRNRTS
jgi:hypothetical protein